MMYKIANENLAITKQDRKSAIEHSLQFVIKNGLYQIDVEVESRKKLELDTVSKNNFKNISNSKMYKTLQMLTI